VPDESVAYTIEDLPALTLAAIRTKAQVEELLWLIPEQLGRTAECAVVSVYRGDSPGLHTA
jgi:hypothetical protein